MQIVTYFLLKYVYYGLGARFLLHASCVFGRVRLAHAGRTVGTSSGIYCLYVVAGRNAVFVSFAPMGYLVFFSTTKVLFGRYYSQKANRRMAFREVFASGCATNHLESEFVKNGFRMGKIQMIRFWKR